MSRLPVVVRHAEPEDAAALVELWSSCVDLAGTEAADSVNAPSLWRQPSTAEAATALDAYVSSPDRRLMVALLDGEIVGVLAVQLRPLTPIHTTRTMIVSDLHISPACRRKFVASTLMSSAVSWAEECDCEVVLTSAPVNSRDAHRFLTRLGFGQVATVRGAQVSVLRSRFAGIATSSRDTGRLIAVRRTLRRRQDSGRKLRPGL
ncbi:GNAT family N-acetyltransferase [Solicola sp. PLA-1-18]|uniref:GNAT family N-acetyltransferase n=1 Tax=Solicola sp. PLA-1-18 TaxID=3380532 RepID=UPI003B80F399